MDIMETSSGSSDTLERPAKILVIFFTFLTPFLLLAIPVLALSLIDSNVQGSAQDFVNLTLRRIVLFILLGPVSLIVSWTLYASKKYKASLIVSALALLLVTAVIAGMRFGFL
jgi:hypothetical protein